MAKKKEYVYYMLAGDELFTLQEPPPKVALEADIPLYMTITLKDSQEEIGRLPGEFFYIGEL